MPGSARHRYRRIDSRARVVLRSGRTQADLQPRQPLRSGRVRVVARSSRPVRKVGSRRRDHASHSGRQRPSRFNLLGARSARLRARADRRREGSPDRRAERIFRRGHGPRSREISACRTQALRVERCLDGRDLPASHRLRDRGVLPGRYRGGERESRALRRHPLRLARQCRG